MLCVTVIIVGNGNSNPSSNPTQSWFSSLGKATSLGEGKLNSNLLNSA